MKYFIPMLLIAAAAPTANAAEHREIVAYRLTNTKTMHVHDEQAARQYKSALASLRCETQLDGHAGHFDLSYRCPDWKRAQFDDHATAHKWEAWLKSLGFEVAHQHE